MKCLLFSVSIFFFAITSVSAQNLLTDKAKTSISFKIKNFGLNVNGHFTEFEIESNFDPNSLADSYFKGKAVIESIETGINARNKSLQKEEYFDSAQFQELSLYSKEIRNIGNNSYELVGELSIKGTTKSITFPFTVEDNSDHIILKGDFELNRREFKVGKSSLVLNNTVKVSITYAGVFK